MSSSKHIIYIPMGGVGLFDDPNDNVWLLYRLSVFREYTLKSILNQTVKPDLLWISFDGRAGNPWIKALEIELNRYLPTLITHTGLIYADDKFVFRLKSSKSYESTFKQAYRMASRSVRKRDIRIFFRYLHRLMFKNRSLIERMDATLPQVRRMLGRFDWAYLTRIDSDDLIHKDWVWEVNNHYPQRKLSLVRQRGYVYNGETLAIWNPQTCPQFFTLCIPDVAFRMGSEFVDYWGDYISHEDANKVFEWRKLEDFRYVMLMHKNQISSVFNHPFKGDIIDNKDILKDYGIGLDF